MALVQPMKSCMFVNVTELENPSKVANRGNGAYFYQEYTKGQVCSGDDPDVKDKGWHAAIRYCSILLWPKVCNCQRQRGLDLSLYHGCHPPRPV